MWAKAEQYLNSERDIVPAPESDSKAMMVASKSSSAPHFVCSTAEGQYSCDNGCLQWKSSKLCVHTGDCVNVAKFKTTIYTHAQNELAGELSNSGKIHGWCFVRAGTQDGLQQ